MKLIRLLPTIVILLEIGASAVCFFEHNNKMAVYWFATAVINVIVVF